MAVEDALRYASAGLAVFPLRPGTKLPATDHGFKDASKDPERIRDLFAAVPGANIGIATGMVSGIAGVDVDVKNGVNGFESLKSYPEAPTLEIETPTKGAHLYYRIDRPIANSAGALGPGLDVRGDGGYLVAPPSLCPEGAYTVRKRLRMAPFPDFFRPAPRPAKALPPPGAGTINGPWTRRRLEKCVEEARDAPMGRRNDALNRASFKLHQMVPGGHLDEATIVSSLLAATELPEAEALRTILSGRDGMKSPIDPPEPRASVAVSAPALTEGRTVEGELRNYFDVGRPGAAALYGAAGELVRHLEHQTEAPVGSIYVQLLAALGNCIGLGPYYRIGSDKLHLNLYTALVGNTATGRKGTSISYVRGLMEIIDPGWFLSAPTSGLASGEGLIQSVHDAYDKTVMGRIYSVPGVADKRKWVVESEFGGLLRKMKRETNTISATIREAYDCRPLQNLTKDNAMLATNYMLTISVHVTREELNSCKSDVSAFDGFLNRFLWVWAARSKLVPRERVTLRGDPVVESLCHQLAMSVENGTRQRELDWDTLSRERWGEVYLRLNGGLEEKAASAVGSIVGRASVQIQKLATLFAVLDGTPEIVLPQLEAALALWRYCEMSAGRIFADRHFATANKIMAAIEQSPAGRLSRTEISAALGRNADAGALRDGLGFLLSLGMIQEHEPVSTPGRPAIYYSAVPLAAPKEST